MFVLSSYFENDLESKAEFRIPMCQNVGDSKSIGWHMYPAFPVSPPPT